MPSIPDASLQDLWGKMMTKRTLYHSSLCPHRPVGVLAWLQAWLLTWLAFGPGLGPRIWAQERLTLLFVGDLMQHQGQIDAARRDGGYDYMACFSLVREQIAAADLAVGNLEVTLGGPPYRGYPAFSAPDAYLKAICDVGFDVLTTGNNHCLDRGRRGLERTIAQLDALGIHYAGTYVDSLQRSQRYPLFVKKKGFLIAFLNYTYDTNGLRPTGTNIVNYIDRDQIRRDIAGARARRPDAIIALMHWGLEYHNLPSREQRRLADWLLAEGVTHIIGCHPHVVQPMEIRCDGRQDHVVVYSLGNFISNMQRPGTDGGLIFTMILEKYPLATEPVGAPFVVPSASSDLYASSTPPSPIAPPLSLGPYVPDQDRCYRPDLVELAYPYTRLVDCGYRLVWTARPTLHSGDNFVVMPVDCAPMDQLTPRGQQLLDTFTRETRLLMSGHYGGIDER